MHRPPDLRARFIDLTLLPARKRWRPFEGLLASLFKRGHFKIERASQAAGGRQLDLVASRRGGPTYMVEAKWRSKPLPVGDIDGLYSRLDGAPATTVGVLISPSGFTGGLKHEVVKRKHRPVVLVGPVELLAVLDDPRSLARLFQRKLDHFTVTGEVLVGPNEADFSDSRLSDWGLRQPHLADASGNRLPYIRSAARFDEFVFTQELADIDWVPGGGRGVSLDLRPDIQSEGDLIEALRELLEGGWLSTGATWVIEQFDASWHGLGWQSFADAVVNWEQRYDEIDHVHHTEQLCLTDSVDGHLLVLTCDLSAGDERACRHANLCFHLQGVPLEPEPFVHLAETLGDDGPIHWRPMVDRSVETAGFRGHRLLLDPVAYVIENHPEDERYPVWVRGVVVVNPFGDDRPEDADEWPAGLNETELVVCSLGQWHPWGDTPERYELRNVEWAHTTNFAVVRVVGDWRGDLTEPDGTVRVRG